MTQHTLSSRSASSMNRNKAVQGRRYTESVKPKNTSFCCVCMFSQPDLKDLTSGAKYHTECFDELMREFHQPPDRLVPHNRSKE